MDVEEKKVTRGIIVWVNFSIIIILGIVALGMWGCPHYRVYQQEKEGQATLANAQYSRNVAICEAQAKMESAAMLASADTIRAHGIARSNQIIGNSLTEPYLHWFWIDGLERNQNAVIYVPTEANIPIMEAGRLKTPVEKSKK